MHSSQRHGRRVRSRMRSAAVAAPLFAVLGWQLGAAAVVAATVAGAALLLWPMTAPEREPETDQTLRDHLARARRREEPVDLVVLWVDEDAAPVVGRLRRSLRVTDSAYVTTAAGGRELRAIVDRQRLDRDALQARLSRLAGCPLRIGWARFPENGYTVASLVEHARTSAGTIVPGGEGARDVGLPPVAGHVATLPAATRPTPAPQAVPGE